MCWARVEVSGQVDRPAGLGSSGGRVGRWVRAHVLGLGCLGVGH